MGEGIVIDTKINLTGFEEGIKGLKSAADSFVKSASDSFKKFAQTASKTVTKAISGLKGAMTKATSSIKSLVSSFTKGNKGFGIIGRAASTNINNTLVIGSIESSYLGDNVGRTSGDKFSTNQDNYAWDKQSINSVYTSNTEGET